MIKLFMYLIIIAIFLALISTIFTIILTILTTPAAWIGIGITLFGFYQLRQRKKGKLTFSKPHRIIVAGILLTIILGLSFNDKDTNNVENVAPTNHSEALDDKEVEEPKIKTEQYDVVWGTYDNEWVYSDE